MGTPEGRRLQKRLEQVMKNADKLRNGDLEKGLGRLLPKREDRREERRPEHKGKLY